MLVIGEDVELAVALRDRLDRAYVTVCEVRSPEAAGAVRGCQPWPWMVVGSSSALADALGTLLAGEPTLVLWHGEPPAGLPAHTRRMALFSELATAAQAAIDAEVGGVRLAPGTGLTMPDGGHASSPALEALVASHPRPLFAAGRWFRGAAATLDSHGVPLRVTRVGSGGRTLAPRAA